MGRPVSLRAEATATKKKEMGECCGMQATGKQ